MVHRGFGNNRYIALTIQGNSQQNTEGQKVSTVVGFVSSAASINETTVRTDVLSFCGGIDTENLVPHYNIIR